MQLAGAKMSTVGNEQLNTGGGEVQSVTLDGTLTAKSRHCQSDCRLSKQAIDEQQPQNVSDYYTIATVLAVSPDDNNDMITSFSNPNYGLDAVNSNSLTSPCEDFRHRMTSSHTNATHDCIDNLNSSNSKDRVDNIRCHYLATSAPIVPVYDQVDVSSTSCSSTESDEDSAVEIPTPPASSSAQRVRSVCNVQSSAAARAVTMETRSAAMTTELQVEPSDYEGSGSTTSPATSCSSSNKETSIFFPDVYSPDSSDSGIITDNRGRAVRRWARGNNSSTIACDVTAPVSVGSEASNYVNAGISDDQQSVNSCAESVTDELLPSGWEKHEDEAGAYYWHIKSGTIQRQPPKMSTSDSAKAVRKLSTATSSSSSTCDDSERTTVTTTTKLNDDYCCSHHQQTCSGSSRDEIDCQQCGWCQHCPQLEGVERGGFPIRFAVCSLGWVQMSDEDLTPERSSKAVNRCIVGLSVGKNDINDVAGRWGDGKSLYLELDEDNVTLIDPQDLSILNVQPIQSIRIWGVGRNNGRDFAYVARDGVTRKHMCHVFRCDGLARHIANALRDICKRILAERAALRRNGGGGSQMTGETEPVEPSSPTTNAASDASLGVAGGAGVASSGSACRPTNLPTVSRRGLLQVGSSGDDITEHLTFESIFKNTSFPTPMEEPKKIVRCHYLGTTQVSRPTGMDVLNNAMDNVYTRALPEKWVYVNVAVAPSTITISEHGKQENVFAECRVRFLSFMGIAMNNVRLCAFIMHCAQDQFVAHVFNCDPSASILCKTIEAACKLRYQKCLDAGHVRTAAHQSAMSAKRTTAKENQSLRVSLRQGVQSVIGNLTKGCKP